jgi:glycosyltransferase involved in cell wall biosynthesis
MSDSPDLAVYLPSLDGGGAEIVMLRLAVALAERGLRTDLVLARARGPYLNEVPDDVRIVDLRAPAPVVATKTVQLARYLRRERPATVLSALDVVNTALIARSLARVPCRLLLTVHTHLSRQFEDKPDLGLASLRRALVRALYPRTDGLVAVSRGVADDVARIAGLPPDRVQVIHNPVITDELVRRADAPVDHPFLRPGEPPVILAVGRLVRQKDYPTLFDAFARVRRQRPARLLILGDADAREPAVPDALAKQVTELGIAEDVALPGFVPNPQAYMARADVMALSSIYEGLPTVITEALAMGTTVVSTDCESGPREILEGGKFGILVPVRDPQALADGILAALDEPLDPGLLRARADDFRAEPAADNYLQVIGDLGRGRAAVAGPA